PPLPHLRTPSPHPHPATARPQRPVRAPRCYSAARDTAATAEPARSRPARTGPSAQARTRLTSTRQDESADAMYLRMVVHEPAAARQDSVASVMFTIGTA